MKKSIKFLSLILGIILIFCSCGKKTSPVKPEDTSKENTSAGNNDEKPVKKDKKSLPFCTSDGINPFFAKSYENLYLSRLLYESLFSVTEKYEAKPLLADAINIDGKSATVILKSGMTCHGSTPVTAEDVVYSFNMAKNSYAYSASLQSIESATVSSLGSVTFKSAFADSQVALKLTFPVVKAQTADLPDGVPIGHGQYYFSENKLMSADGKMPNIELVSVNTKESSANAYKIGNTDIYFNDLSDCDYKQLHGNYNSADLNNMIYLGLNSNLGGLNKNIRAAIAVLINSEEIATENYQGHARPCKAPCNPSSHLFAEIDEEAIPLSGDAEKAAKITDRCGYTRYSGKALTNGAYVLSFSLIVNKDNPYRVAAAYRIADTLNEAGFFIEVKSLSFEDYSERIAAGNYDMYLGEIKLDYSMDLSAFFSENGSLSAGTDKEKISKKYYQMRMGKITYAEFYDVFIETYPFIPIAFRDGAIFTSDDLNTDFSAFPYSLY